MYVKLFFDGRLFLTIPNSFEDIELEPKKGHDVAAVGRNTCDVPGVEGRKGFALRDQRESNIGEGWPMSEIDLMTVAGSNRQAGDCSWLSCRCEGEIVAGAPGIGRSTDL